MKTILISAYACEPDKGSEPGVGWNWAKHLAKKNRVIVITRKNNRTIIEKELQDNPCENIEFYYCDVSPKLTFWKKGQRGLHLYYYLWQVENYKLAKKIMAKKNVDIAMCITFGNMWLPTFMYKLPCKFIWGPIGGGEGIPQQLWINLNTKQRLLELIRIFNRHIPISNLWFRTICKNSDLIIVRTNDSLNVIPKNYRDKCKIMIETGVSQQECALLNSKMKNAIIKYDFIFMGRLISLKMIDIAIKAFSIIAKEDKHITFHIVGDGECKTQLKNLIKELNLEERIILHGNKTRDEALEMLMASKYFLFPSAKEGGAWVLFEAMMCSKPVICFDTSGMSMIVSNETGIKIPIESYENSILNFANAMRYLINNTEYAEKMGRCGYQRVLSEFEWQSKANFINRIIDNLN